MTQEIINTVTVDTQLNVNENHGTINAIKKTRFSKRFEKLNTEVASDDRYEGTMESLKYYLTKRDGIDMPTKLEDGGFKVSEIIEAARRKEKFAKRLEINRFFESAQWIDSQLFAIIKMKFEAHVDPLICNGSIKEEILKVVVQNVIEPVLEVINIEGENDEVLNYNAEDIFGMIYYLTEQCHLNWKDYDSIQPSI